MAERIFMSVPKVPWHCEHNVNRKECDICGRPDSSSDVAGRDSADSGRDSAAGPGADGRTRRSPASIASGGHSSGNLGSADLIGAWYADDILARGAAD